MIRSLLVIGVALLASLAFVPACTDGGQDLCQDDADGTPCGTAQVCVDGQCSFSYCGDGVIDAELGEQCDDGNEVANDGCEPGTCTFSCTAATDCDDGFPCNGEETCNSALHRCQAQLPPANGTVDCTMQDDGEGLCRHGVCAPAACGNGELDPFEDCDDESPGCGPDCRWVCVIDADCDDGNPCNGAETCDVGSHTCSAAPQVLDCDDGDPCSDDTCEDFVGCQYTQNDGDGDQYSPHTCAAGSEFRGGDCNDDNPNVYPGAPALCDGLDNDCDDIVDTGPNIVWYADRDNDGFPDQQTTLTDCMDPNERNPRLTIRYIQPPTTAGGQPQWDCADNHATIRPGITTYSHTPFCAHNTTGRSQTATASGTSWSCNSGYTLSWDRNCNGTQERLWTGRGACTCPATGTGYRWASVTSPSCGTLASMNSCNRALVIGFGTVNESTSQTKSCVMTTRDMRQQCR